MTASIQVLHVDDEPEFAELAADFLRRADDRFDVVTETSAEAGMEVLDRRDIDCIVSDHDMPGMNGIEFLEAIREENPDLPFILFTGKGSEAVASKAVSAGVTDYLQKETGTDHYTLLANRIENAVERYRSERAVERQKRRLETLVSNLPGIVYRCSNDPEWPMEDVEGECEQLTGYSAAAIEAGDIVWGTDVVHEDDQAKVWNEVQHAIDQNEPFECTYRITTADGETKWIWERGRGVEATNGEVEAIEGFITDITESKRRERRFEAIFNNTYQFTGLIDPDGRIVEVNEAALSFAGIDRDEAVGTPLWEGAWFESNERASETVREAVETARRGELFREEFTIQGEDEVAVVDFSIRPITDEDGDVTMLVPEGRNVTELKERERTLQRNENRFEAIFNDPNLLVGLLDTDGTVRDVNDTSLEYLDADRDDVLGRPFWDTPWWTDDQRDDVRAWVDAAADGKYVEYDATHSTDDGAPITVEGNFRPVTGADGEVTRIVVSATDVTERKRRERELKRRNERFDEFASFVSHDLQSPVSAVKGRLELALDTGDLDHVEKAVDAIDRVDELRADLVNTLRTGEIVSATEQVGVEPAMHAVWSAIDPPNAASFRVPTECTVEADPDAFQRMLENLVGNSIEHGGDAVDIRVGPRDEGFYYEDDGPGIDPEHRTRVFTPGYSTKEGEEGIGMGMASIRQIVLAHGWEISIEDAQRLDGVRFELRTDS
ncbi:PAS domain S-box-containing protein [Natronoarchaeum philippinense]|uniref:histidine kinase n=1 Tax=Natronoarchaeum philippinense TaxID=558529 RepID=A0A285P9U3_NATPI|nr:PAS domain S-box protein [Natronoarchaeum philippinense]SNZ16896.1 PAS domain S-box-containing protein [Natronoarchaeum philippinense]